jgi:hypothetical protein
VRADAAAADRRHDVREAARSWRRVGAVGDDALAAIEALYPDDRRRLGPVFRVLAFVFTVVALSGLFGVLRLLLQLHDERKSAILLMLFGVALAAATEVQKGPLRRTQGGTEAATATLAVVSLAGGAAWLLADAGLRTEEWIDATLAILAAVCAAAAWRWGYTLFAAAAAAALYLYAARVPFGRALWIVGALIQAPIFARAGDGRALPPAHRRSARAVAAVSLAFLYVGVHLGSWDNRWVEDLASNPAPRPMWPVLRVLFAGATALVPLAVLAWGVRTRRRFLLALGAAGVVASLVTLRSYVHVAPLWAVLIAGGGAALAVAAALRRHLESGPGGERAGFTADALFEPEGGLRPLEIAVGVAAATPDARTDEPAPELRPGGGRYGGGGASGNY